MEHTKTGFRKPTLILAIIACCIVAFILSGAIALTNLESTLSAQSSITTDSFTGIMDDYTHSFLQYEKYLQLEIEKAPDTEELSKFLKENDSQLAKIEGDDFDGIYMYYQGQYLYSWDTPYSVYEESGYDATKRPWYTGAVEEKGEICFSVPYRSYANDYMLATISRLQPDGRTVIAYDIKLGAIQSFTENLHLYKGSLTIVCDNDGNIIGTTNPAYAGGNYKLSQGDYEELIAQANTELENATGADEKTKAEKKLDSLTELQAFCAKYQSCIMETATTNKIHLHLTKGVISFLNTNGRYATITLVPLRQMLPNIFIAWAIIFAVLVLVVLLILNIRLRLDHAKELAEKNEQLAEAVERADAASVAKSQFLAQMSHEIRTPMNAVIGLTTIAKTEIHSPEKVA